LGITPLRHLCALYSSAYPAEISPQLESWLVRFGGFDQ
jgi:hypothetical protein